MQSDWESAPDSGWESAPEEKADPFWDKPRVVAGRGGALKTTPREQLETLKAAGKGALQTVLTGGGLGDLSIPPFATVEEYQQAMKEIGAKETPTKYKPVEEFVGLTTGMTGLGEVGALSKVPRYYKAGKKTAEEILSGARSLAEELTGAAKTKAQETAEKAGKEKLTREIAIKKEMARPEKVSPETQQIHTAARSETKFANPDTPEIRAAGKDLTSDIQKQASAKLQEAEAKQAGGGKEFSKYLDLGKQLERTQRVAQSAAGKKGAASLLNMSKDMSLTPETRDLAKRTYIKLFPKEGTEAFNTFDVEYRRLMDTAEGKSVTKVGPEEAKVFKSVAGAVEKILKDFVGEANYARPIYARESKDLNQFRKDLGDALAFREKGEYEVGPGGIEYSSKPAELLFKDRQSVNMGRQILGSEVVNSFAERYAANLLDGKSSQEISKLLNSDKFAFAYETPGLWEKIQKYGESVARREGDAKALSALQSQMEKHLKTVGTVADQVQTKAREAIKTINTNAKQIAKQGPEKIRDTWLGVGGAPGMRTSLEETGLFEKADLDRLETELLRAGELAEKEASAAAARQAITSFLGMAAKKYGLPVSLVGGVGAAGLGAYELLKSE